MAAGRPAVLNLYLVFFGKTRRRRHHLFILSRDLSTGCPAAAAAENDISLTPLAVATPPIV